MLNDLPAVFLLSAVTASIAFTVAETKIFKGLREWLKANRPFLGDLFSCGYCFGHWIAFFLTAIYRPRLFHAWPLMDYFLTALLIAWSAAFQWILLCLLVQKVGK